MRKLVLTKVINAFTVMAFCPFAILAQQSPDIEAIEKSVLLSWSEEGVEEQIVLVTETVGGPWAPLPEPNFARNGKRCVAVSITHSDMGQWLPPSEYMKLTKLTPGRQFSDDFNPPHEPFATENSWEALFYATSDASRFSFTFTNGMFEIRNSEAPANGRVILLPPGPHLDVRDFYGAVDILNWDTNAVDLAIAIVARGQLDPQGFPGDSNGYIGGVIMNPSGNMGQARPFLFTGDVPDNGGTPFSIDSDATYRLSFSGVGDQLSVQLVNLTNEDAPVQERPRTDTTFSQGPVGLWLQTAGSAIGNVTLDNFFLTGTKP